MTNISGVVIKKSMIEKHCIKYYKTNGVQDKHCTKQSSMHDIRTPKKQHARHT